MRKKEQAYTNVFGEPDGKKHLEELVGRCKRKAKIRLQKKLDFRVWNGCG